MERLETIAEGCSASIVVNLEYAYRQMELPPETSKHRDFAVTGKSIKGYYRFLKRIYGSVDIPALFQERIDRTLCHQTTNDKFTKIGKKRYKASKKKSRIYRNETV